MPTIPDITEQPAPADVMTPGGVTRSRLFRVVASSRLKAIEKLAGQKGVKLNAVYENVQGEKDPTVVCKRLNVEGKPEAPLNGTGLYTIEAEYESVQGDSNEKKPEPGGPWIWTVRATLACRPVDLDVNRKPITNSAQEPIDPPLTPLMPEEVLHGEGIVQAASALIASRQFSAFGGKVNSHPFLGYPTGCLLFYPVQTDDSDTGFVRVAVDMQFRPPKSFGGKTYEGWVDVFIDRGTRYIYSDNGHTVGDKYRTIDVYDKDTGNISGPVTSPVPLDGNGQELDISKLGQVKYAYIEAVHYERIDFNTLPGLVLPTTSVFGISNGSTGRPGF